LVGIEPTQEISAVTLPKPTSSEGSTDGDVQKQLDRIYVEIGQAAANQEVPALLKRNQQMVQANQKKLATLKKALASAEGRVNRAVGGGERMRFSTEVARLQGEMKNVQNQVEFGYLILGRECVSQGHEVVGVSAQLDKANRLQAGL
jgi:tRNA U34 5-carboxymethylaminomethyl modifying enzyme MnmG/GidA